MELNIDEYEFYIRPGVTDMRKGARSLAIFIQQEMKLCPFDKKIFLFCGGNRRTMKAVVWDGTGWLEIIKRLECDGSFKWPKDSAEAMKVTFEQVRGALRGEDSWRRFESLQPKYAN